VWRLDFLGAGAEVTEQRATRPSTLLTAKRRCRGRPKVRPDWNILTGPVALVRLPSKVLRARKASSSPATRRQFESPIIGAPCSNRTS